MKKNIFFLASIVVGFLFCYNYFHKKKHDTPIQDNQFTNSKILKTRSKIIGKWGIYVIVSNGSSIYCNACPTINFTDKKIAILTKPNDDKEYYDWMLKENSLTLKSQDEEITDNYFNISEFEIEIKKNKKFTELKLLKSENSGYVLRK